MAFLCGLIWAADGAELLLLGSVTAIGIGNQLALNWGGYTPLLSDLFVIDSVSPTSVSYVSYSFGR